MLVLVGRVVPGIEMEVAWEMEMARYLAAAGSPSRDDRPTDRQTNK